MREGGKRKVESVVEWRQHFSPLRSRYLPTRVTLGHACCAADTWLLGLPRQQTQHHHHRHDIDALKCRFRPKPGQGWADPTPSVKCLCVCVSVLFFFCVLKDFFLCLRAVVSSGELESCRAVGYFMCVQLSGWSCRLSSPPSPHTPLQRQISIRFGSYFYSVAAAAARQVRAGGFKRLKLRIRRPSPLPLYWVPCAAELVLSVWP